MVSLLSEWNYDVELQTWQGVDVHHELTLCAVAE
jgi:hypothetical protein